MDEEDLIRVRLVRISHPNRRSATRRLLYRILRENALETPFGFILLNPDAWRKLEELNERAKAEIGKDAIIYVNVYIPRSRLIALLKSALSEVEPTSSRALLIAAALRRLDAVQ